MFETQVDRDPQMARHTDTDTDNLFYTHGPGIGSKVSIIAFFVIMDR